MYDSRFGKSSCYMCNNDKYLVWQHILQHYNEDLDKTLIRPLKLLPQPGPILEKRAGSDTLKKTIYF